MKTELTYQINSQTKTVSVEREGASFQITIGEQRYTVTAQQVADGEFDLDLDGQRLRAYVARVGSRRYVALAGETWLVEEAQTRRRKRTGAASGAALGGLEATMPGSVLEVPVSEGDEVARGDTLVLLEAMKMELRISAPYAGQVSRVHCEVGQVVERGQVLVELI